MTGATTHVVDVFVACQKAIADRKLIVRDSVGDKEFHFQNWFEHRLGTLGVPFERGGRNSYPDFRIIPTAEGYEVKALAFPGREASYDANSQVPSGFHNGRAIYYVFGRYPKNAAEKEYPVLDLLICHGDFLNANHDYIHKNRSVRGFGSYGDLLIRDRKMYVAPTPFAITVGTTGQRTLILPENVPGDERLQAVGQLERVEAESFVVAYTFDLTTSTLTPTFAPNPAAGTVHRFIAYRVRDEADPGVSLASVSVEELVSVRDEDGRLENGDE